MPYLAWIKAGLVAALAAGLLAFGYHFGAQGVQAAWDKDQAERAEASNRAILKRTADNAALVETQRETNRLLTKAHDAELSQVRADLAAAGRLRIGSALCGGSANTAKAASTGSSSDATDPASRILSAEMDGAVKSLILEMEETAATGRAAQTFIRENGFAP